MRKDGRKWDKDEPARERNYRKLYHRYKRDMDRFEDMVTMFMKRLDDLAKRVEVLEFKDHNPK